MDVYDEYKTTVLGVQHVPYKDVSKYGIIEGEQIGERIFRVTDLVEKPEAEKAPSNIAILGRYIISPEIFSYLEKAEPGKGGEIQLTDALKELLNTGSIYAYDFTGKRYDVGNKLGFLEATVEFALKRDDLRDDFMNYLKKIVGGM